MQLSPTPLSLKKLLTTNKNWYRYEQHHLETNKPLREAVLRSVSQILSCKHYLRGHAQYHCSNTTCTHEKRVPFTCKNRMCNSCGKLASDKWVAKQLETLPRTEWQHITSATRSRRTNCFHDEDCRRKPAVSPAVPYLDMRSWQRGGVKL